MSKKPVCIGSGLVALDVVISNNPSVPNQFLAGGSCGNVITILSYLGWDCYPIARLSNNVAGDILIHDLLRWNVKDDLLTLSDDGSTPVIIHRILRSTSGEARHKFEFKNPEDGTYLPSYKATLLKSVPAVLDKVSEGNVFYFDRLSPSTIEMAKGYKKKKTIIFFEPSSNKDLKGFEECLKIADVVKFSNDRISNYSELFPKGIAPLEIQTLGKDGLQFRLKGSASWQNVPAFSVDGVLDSAGAGDWCTAGIIMNLFGSKPISRISESDIFRAIRFGQALSALNCRFEGARGLMYNASKRELFDILDEIDLSSTHHIDAGNPTNDFPVSKLNIQISALLNQCSY
jgi:fructokinase